MTFILGRNQEVREKGQPPQAALSFFADLTKKP
jgi:hypothetical protein